MAISYLKADKKQIENIIKSEDFYKFKREIEKKLNIQNVEYEIKSYDVAMDKDNFPEQYTNAKLKFKNNWSEIDKLFFYTENIEESINGQFSKLSSNKLVFSRVIEVCTKFALVHELIHIQQFQQGRLTKAIMDQENALSYENRPLEIEANTKTYNIIGSYGVFEERISEHIYSNTAIDNDSAQRILEISF